MGEPRRQRLRRGDRAPLHWRDFAVPALPLVACFLGGATEKWAEGIVVALLGVIWLANPPRRSQGLWFHLVALLLVSCAALAFLPASWFPQPAWREVLRNDFNLILPATLSPQPWISAGGFGSLVAGLGWLYYASAQELDGHALRRQLRVFAGGVALLAALMIGLYLAKTALPFWHNQRGFGPFPNRNQTADLLGISAVILLACGQEELRKGRKRWVFWLLGVAVIAVALVLNFSRAGLAIFVVGSAFWLGLLVLRSGSPARIALGFSALLVLLTAVLLFGGATLERFHLRGGEGANVSADFRWLIFRDTLELIRTSPWTGIGLGNFSPVFSIFRDASSGQNRVLHPESDWLWTAAELGWPAVVLLLLGAALLLRRFPPLGEGTNVRLRLAALLAASLFALHGLVDVSGHRVGSAYAGLFLFALALHRPATSSRSLPVIFRGLGAMLIVLGGTWAWSSSLPGGIGADTARRLATKANAEGDYPAVIAQATRGLQWAPLDWQLYFVRALGEVGAGRPNEALADFRRARFFESTSFEVPYQEGLAWVTRDPLLTLTAWREALRRAGTERATLYARMLSSATQLNPAVRRRLLEFGSVQPDLALTFLARATGADFEAALERLLAHDPALASLSAGQQRELFALWRERGERARLLVLVEENPSLLPQAWRAVAQAQAERGDFRAAVELAQRFSLPPKLPETANVAPAQGFAPNDYLGGLALYQEQMRAGKIADALITVRRFTDQPAAPAYFHFLEAQAWAAQENWERAWTAWRKFDPKL